MANRHSKHFGNGKDHLRSVPTPRPVQLDPNTLSSLHCPQCLNNAFNSVQQFLEVPAVLANTPDGQPALMRVEAMLCVNCGAVWNVQQLKKLSPIEREEIRIQRQLEHEAFKDQDLRKAATFNKAFELASEGAQKEVQAEELLARQKGGDFNPAQGAFGEPDDPLAE